MKGPSNVLGRGEGKKILHGEATQIFITSIFQKDTILYMTRSSICDSQYPLSYGYILNLW